MTFVDRDFVFPAIFIAVPIGVAVVFIALVSLGAPTNYLLVPGLFPIFTLFFLLGLALARRHSRLTLDRAERTYRFERTGVLRRRLISDGAIENVTIEVRTVGRTRWYGPDYRGIAVLFTGLTDGNFFAVGAHRSADNAVQHARSVSELCGIPFTIVNKQLRFDEVTAF